MFYALSEDLEYFKKKLNIFVALGPVTKISHTQSDLLVYAAKFYDLFYDAVYYTGIDELLG